MAARENKVETYLKASVAALGGVSRKWVSPGRSGVPDQIVIIKGQVWFVEVKTLGGRLSDVQKREHERLIKAGANVTTVYGTSGVDEFIRGWEC